MATKIQPSDPLGVQVSDAKLLRIPQSADFVAVKRPELRVKTVLSLPLISMAHRDVLVCQMMSEPYAADFEVGPSNEKPPMLIRLLDLDTMTQSLLVCNALVLSALERAGGKLTGRYFRFMSGEMKQGKQFTYREIRAEEMEISNAEEK